MSRELSREQCEIEKAKTERRSLKNLFFEACKNNDAELCFELLKNEVSMTCNNPNLFYSIDSQEYISGNDVRLEFHEDGSVFLHGERCYHNVRTPIIECAIHGHESLVMALIGIVEEDEPPFNLLSREQYIKSFLYTSKNDNGAGLWHFAAEQNMFKLAAKLKEKGILSDCSDDWGYTPLHFATPEMIPIVIESGCDKEAHGGEIGMTPLQDAVWRDDWVRFSALLKAGCSIESITNGEELLDLEDERIKETLFILRRDLFQ